MPVEPFGLVGARSPCAPLRARVAPSATRSVPTRRSGANTEENLLVLCESHHLAHHAGALLIEGPASTPRFTRRADNAFAIAERAIETGKALRALGFDKHEVATAVNATRAHVGTTELRLESWIRTTLGYWPKPLG